MGWDNSLAPTQHLVAKDPDNGLMMAYGSYDGLPLPYGSYDGLPLPYGSYDGLPLPYGSYDGLPLPYGSYDYPMDPMMVFPYPMAIALTSCLLSCPLLFPVISCCCPLLLLFCPTLCLCSLLFGRHDELVPIFLYLHERKVCTCSYTQSTSICSYLVPTVKDYRYCTQYQYYVAAQT